VTFRINAGLIGDESDLFSLQERVTLRFQDINSEKNGLLRRVGKSQTREPC